MRRSVNDVPRVARTLALVITVLIILRIVRASNNARCQHGSGISFVLFSGTKAPKRSGAYFASASDVRDVDSERSSRSRANTMSLTSLLDFCPFLLVFPNTPLPRFSIFTHINWGKQLWLNYGWGVHDFVGLRCIPSCLVGK